jgi:aspartate aminotransferase
MYSDVCDLGVGQPDFPTPEHICEAARAAIREGYTRYTPQPGFEDLREAIAAKFLRENGFEASPEQIVVSCGAKHSLYNLFQCLLRGGGEVLVLRPYWYATPKQVLLAGGRPVFIDTPAEADFLPDPAEVAAAITPQTRAIVLNTPSNPTGAVFPRALLEQLGEIACREELYLISDEVYERMVFDGAEHLSLAALDEGIAARTITVNSVSKTHSMTGWRIGYAAMPTELAAEVTELQSLSTSGPCAISQRAALAAIEGPQDHVERMVAEYAQRRRELLERIRRTPHLACRPQPGSIYHFVDVSDLLGRRVDGREIRSVADVAAWWLEAAGVKVIPGSDSGAAHHVRLSFAASRTCQQEAMNRLEALLRAAKIEPAETEVPRSSPS